MELLKREGLRGKGCLPVLVLTLTLAACGKFAAPRPPEDFSPREVDSLQVLAGMQGVKFNWQAPQKDMRGRALKSIDGYWIYRKEIERPSDIMDDSKPYELLATIQDTHLLELDKMREEAEKAGKITRRVKIGEEKKKFEYTDMNVQSGKTYLYQVIPYNQEGVPGNCNQLIKVLFRGDSSEVAFIPYRGIGEQSFQ